MYAQFFGNFLLSHEVITKEQLLKAMEQKAAHRPNLGTLAIHAGYMSASEVDHIHILQTHQDLKFGELAIQTGILTQEQVNELLSMQAPDYLALGEALVNSGIIDNYELERLIVEYASENEIYDLDSSEDSRFKVEQLFKHYLKTSKKEYVNEYELLYNTLLFNNLVRFIGDDFTPILGSQCLEYPKSFCVSQEIRGKFHIKLYIDMPETACMAFASRYTGDTFDDFDEYVAASLEDFVNLHNGLFCVNVSNDHNIELELLPPKIETSPLFEFKNEAFLMPVIYPFGTINFIFELDCNEK